MSEMLPTQQPVITMDGQEFDSIVELIQYDTKLTPPQKKTLIGVRQGLSLVQAAKAAEYANPKVEARNMRTRPYTLRYLEAIYSEISKETRITKDTVEGIFVEAVDMARVQADPLTMIRGGQELGKMNGFYAPEVKRVELTTNAARLKTDYEELSTEDLLRLAGDDESIDIDPGDYEEID